MQNIQNTTTYPISPGHEIVGTITKIGSEVPPSIPLVHRYGLGWIKAGSCCAARTNTCPSQVRTIYGSRGGFTAYLIADYRLLVPIPDSLPSSFAAPLMCAGLTLYSALRYWIPRSGGQHVAIIGIGGLGHLGV